VYIDIKPGSCPNPLNVKSRGVLPVAILGTKNFDVMAIDPASISINGVTPLRWSYEDVAAPFTGELCGCNECMGDGYVDLTLKFKTQELVETLNLGSLTGTSIRLTLTATLENGTAISGQDCVRVQGKCKGDFRLDGDVDGMDVQIIKSLLGMSVSDDSEYAAGDFDDDGDIDATDIYAFHTIFGSRYMGSCEFIECKGDFDCDRDVDGTDTKAFKNGFGRTVLYHPCTLENPCVGNFDNDQDSDGSDAASFKTDFGRGIYHNACRGCVEQ
jgi:hypothetical protein